jgi:hypothetical protein
MSAMESETERPTTLTNEQYARCLEAAEKFVQKNGSIRNKQLREIAGVGYDQAIRFFKRATDENRLSRKGIASGTHYVFTSER